MRPTDLSILNTNTKEVKLSNFEEDKQRSIAISVALNNSATLAAALVDADSTADTVLGDYANISSTLVALVLDHHGIGTTRAETIVSDVFPGSTPVQQWPGSASPNPAQVPIVIAMPAAIPGAKDPDWLWRDFLGDPSGWYDNRVGKKNPSGPDFASKKHLNEKGFKEGLWLTGKFPLTAWVKTELQQRGYIS
jgi:hypothetical protein